MSLRDQLLKAGLVDKKKARKLSREEKAARKQAQAQRKSKAQLRAEEEAKAAADRAEQEARLQAQRDAAHRIAEDIERKRLLGSLMSTSRVRVHRGEHPFFHHSADRRHLLAMRVPESVAWDLRSGTLGVAWAGVDPENPEPYVVIKANAARSMLELHPERVVFFNEEAPDPDDPAERLLPTDFEWSPPRLRRP